MRFVFALVAFIGAVLMIGAGVAQRTVLLEPDHVTREVTIENPTTYMVVDQEALAAFAGQQTVTASGSPEVFLSYGRTNDVLAWIGDTAYTSIGYDAEEDALTSSLITPAAEPGDEPAPEADPDAPADTADEDAAEPEENPDATGSPSGSDLWLDQFAAENVLRTTVDIPEGITVLLASDGTEKAPSRVGISWPLDNSTPWAGPLIAGGALLFLIGVFFLITGIRRHRRGRGPRRNVGKSAKRLPSAPKPTSRQIGRGSGRRAIGRSRIAVVPVVAISAMALSGCSADYWPDFTAMATSTPTAEPTATADGEEEPVVQEVTPPAVTVPQMERIMRRIAVLAGDADSERDESLLSDRFTGPAFDAREANYAIRASLDDYAAPAAIRASPITLILPQQSNVWPRVVMVVTQNEDDPTEAPIALVLQQQSPRENYHIVYEMALAPDAQVPPVAPASIGAPIISPEFKGLLMPPGEVAAAYADVLLKGSESEYDELFTVDGDVLREQLGVRGQREIAASLPDTADIEFSNEVGDGPTVALATNDSGALVSVEIEQREKVTPNDGGTIGFEEGSPGAALSGFDGKSAKGVQRRVSLQLLFYVPGVGSDGTITLLGWSENLISASEVK
ncbi:hypothetical protein ARHIZOSPH14_29240 [Agromyces rhizosphaerae]|uniref:DUF8094 domain-containing protein n=1 Tax=Agromyces rhizosphaerae TaxID=88374 RepID=A0A9W6FSF2_9MICO|nr:hypothetical protein [Agromyces rhizosphaerae]GLI28682.1 hypothetical protein ARHIZOSPH14_29240 [Agromyces rhizosphaerae]